MPDEAKQRPEESGANGFLPKGNLSAILLFSASTCFFWASLYIYSPILPVHAQYLGASLSIVGVVVASYALPQLLFRIPLGLWSDAMGKRKPLAIAGIIMAIVGAAIMGVAPSPLLLTIGRAATGVSAAVWVILSVYFVSLYPPESTGRAMGFLNFVQSIAMAGSPLAGGIIAQSLGSHQTFNAAALLGVLSLITMLPVRDTKPAVRGTFSFRDLGKVAANKHLLLISGLGILLHFAQFSTVFGFLPVYGKSIGASSTELGILTMLTTFAGAISSLAAPRLTERWGYRSTLLIGASVMAVMMAGIPFITSVPLLEVNQFIGGLGRGLIPTTLMTQSVLSVPAHQRATAMGIYQATYSIGMLAGPLTSGFVAESLGLDSIFYLSAFMAVVLAVVSRLPLKALRS